MRRLQKQQGFATVVLVTLIGLSVMTTAGVVANKLVTQRTAGVAAHAQTNAQVMGWAGVGAFRQYLLDTGKDDLVNVTVLQGGSVALLYEANKKEITARNIRISGCTDAAQPCSVTADIQSISQTSKAATTIEATYNLALVNGQVAVVNQKGQYNFGGNTSFTGATTLDSELPNQSVVINADGDLSLNLGFKTNNISKLDINATGDVYIDCGAQNCGSATINVTTRGKVTLLNGNKFGEINALGTVTLRLGAKAKNIKSASKVTLESGSSAEHIESKNDVSLSLSTAKNITAQGSVTLSASTAQQVKANGSVSMDTGAKAQSIDTLSYVYMMTNAYVSGDVIAEGNQTTTQGAAVYLISGATVNGNIYAKGDIRLITPSVKVNGGAYASGRVLNGIGNHWVFDDINTYGENSSTALTKATSLTTIVVDTSDIEEVVNEDSNFTTRVDVTVYQDEANYIFSRATGFNRVFLNKLKNKANNKTYVYEHGMQFVVSANGANEVASTDGFAIGDYTLNGNTYTGAICLTASNGVCTSDIVGYLPRISVGKTLGIDHAYSHVALSNTWYVRALSDRSPIDNATLAPGIMYFDGDLEIAGNATWQADSSGNAFTNTFLADGNITALAFSPRIYSPYNVVRDNGTSERVCNRTLKTVNGNNLTISATTPATLSDIYLVPTNLCTSSGLFSRNMDKNDDDSQKQVVIDGDTIPKLDLGKVALMANGTVRVGACSQIFGDVLARKRFEGSAACGITDSPNAVTGNITTQNEGTPLSTTFGSGTNLVVPDPSIAAGNGGPNTASGLKVTGSELKWSRYK